MARLYRGDNLIVLREQIADASVDLVYLDPPFNAHASYAMLFKDAGKNEELTATLGMEPAWRWGAEAEAALAEVVSGSNPILKLLMQTLRETVGANPLMAHLAMMAIRLVEIRRVLRPTGSLYLHCDPGAGHYLKLVLDAVFGPAAFRREIVWRAGWVSGFKTRTANWVRNHDTIFYYLRDPRATWTFNKQFVPHDEGYVRRGGGGNPQGKPIDDVWDDPALYWPGIKSYSTEKVGFPSQKPVALLERIIAASSNPNDVVLDPFCGSGSTLEAAQKLGRAWIGIDLSEKAIALAEKRLRDGQDAARPIQTTDLP